MPSTDDPGPLDGLTYSAAEWRRMDVLDFQANGSAGGAVGGIRPGDPGLAVSLSGTTITVTAGVAVCYHSGVGTYRASFPSSTTLTLTAANATNPRVDLVYLRVWDNAVDGTGLFKADIVYLAGTPAVSPVAPSPGATEIYTALATISVPKSGGGSPSVSSAARTITVAPGGIAPSSSATGTYAGQYRDTGVPAGTLQRFNGTSWQDLVALAQGGQFNVGGSGSNAAFTSLMALITTAFLSSRVAGDTFNRLLVTADGTQSYGPGNAAPDVVLARTGVGQYGITGAVAISNGLNVAAGVGSYRSFAKAADTSRTSTTTLADDLHLAGMALEANATYSLQGWIEYVGAAIGTGDLKMGFTTPAGCTMNWNSGGVVTTGANSYDATAPAAATSRTVGSGGAVEMVARLGGRIITTTAGILTLQWAQGTSSATATTIRAGSWLRLERIA